MTCVVCHGENVQLQDVQEDLRSAQNIVCVPVRALVCQTCGERYYDRRTVRYLEEVEKEIKEGHPPLKEVGKVLTYG